MAVSHLPVTISNTPRCALPNEFSAISPHLEAITVISGIRLVAHESYKCHVNRRHPELKSFKMETEVLTKTIEDLIKGKDNKYLGHTKLKTCNAQGLEIIKQIKER